MDVKLILQPDEKTEFQFGYALIADKEFAEFLGYPEKPTCQHCKSPIMEMPFYYCKETKKVFCRDCVYGAENICIPERYENGHKHFRIIKLKVKDADVEENVKSKFTDDGFEIV